ncbi:MAG: histidinol dehydrogenase [Balneolaceae bacterium]
MKSYSLDNLNEDDLNRLCRRPKLDFESVFSQVRPILNEVKEHGDRSVRKFTKEFDGVDPNPVAVTPEHFNSDLDVKQQRAIDLAMKNVHRFHREQTQPGLEVETVPGIKCMQTTRPIERVGLYIPGGTAPLPSTAIMLGVPALTAGCKTIILATPPDKDGNIPTSIAYIAKKIGVEKIVRAGGAQAIAAMAYGTDSVPKVDKILGPGNQYVTAAKMLLQNSDAMISIDLPAGPSEVLVIADSKANPEFVAVDLLSQAEHGPDSQVVLAALNGFDVETMTQALESQLKKLPRASTARKALENSFILQVETMEQAISFSNRYAPEHLILNCDEASSYTDLIQNAGSVFLGAWTPESLGDYASGTNHTLPTYGYARMFSGVNLQSFQKSITFQQATPEGLKHLGPTVEILAGIEGLEAHGKAVSLRLQALKKVEG